jgi:hypothetical protein
MIKGCPRDFAIVSDMDRQVKSDTPPAEYGIIILTGRVGYSAPRAAVKVSQIAAAVIDSSHIPFPKEFFQSIPFTPVLKIGA